jgi:lysozyme
MDVQEYVKKNEGLRLKPYLCTSGKWTIGYGHNLEEGISEYVAEAILDEDIRTAIEDVLDIFSNDKDEFQLILSGNRYIALVDMMFNLGKPRFLTFKRMIQAIKEKNWDKAANELLDSKYATQVKQRAINNSNLLRKG